MSERQNRFLKTVKNSAVIHNPVLFEAIGIAPVVAMAISLKSAIILSVVSAVELVIIELFACLLLKHLKRSIRMPIYAILGMAINIPMYMLFKFIIPNETANAGIFLPLLAVNSLIALHCERFAVKHKLSETFTDAVSAGASYAFVILVLGIVREVLGNGTFYGIKLNLPVKLSGLIMPFGGFLLLGFMAAVLKSIINKKYPDAKPEEAFDLSEISQSHIVKIKNILNSDFDPYGENEDEAEPVLNIKKAKKEKHDKPSNTTKTEKNKKPEKRKNSSRKKRASAPVSSDTAREKPRAQKISDSADNYLKDFEDMLADLDEYKNKYSVDDETEQKDKTGGAGENEKGGDDE